VQSQEGNKECQKHHYKERQAGDPGCLSELWHESVQNRQELGLFYIAEEMNQGLDFPDGGMSSPFILF
jgi:hypothetical protein